MTLFSKADKKILIILVAVIAVILLVGFIIYQYMLSSPSKVQNLTGGVQIENNSATVSGD
jgi:flagellar basal body-associated protein FliL